MKNPVHFLREIPLFRRLDDQELFDIVRICQRHSFPVGAYICKEGEIGTSMFILEDGEVKITKMLVTKKVVTLATLGRGAVIGEMSLIDPAPRSATAMTLEETVIYEITREDFTHLKANGLTAPFKVLKEIATTLCQRLRDTEQKLDGLVKKAENIFLDEDNDEQQRQQALDMGKELKIMLEKNRGEAGGEGER